MTNEFTEPVEYEIHGFYRTLDLSSSNEIFKERKVSDRQYWNFSKNVTVILGKNGSGKTTILRALAESLFPHVKVANSEQISNTRTMSPSPTWAGGFVIKRTSELFENLDHIEKPTWHRSLWHMLTATTQSGMDWKSYIPIGSQAWKFYGELYNFVAPYMLNKNSDFQLKVNRDFINAGMVLLMPHQFLLKRTGMESKLFSANLLPVRCAFNNEDSEFLQSHFEELKLAFENILKKFISDDGQFSELAYLDFALALEKARLGDNNSPDNARLHPVDSPLFNPWNLGGRFAWMTEELDLLQGIQTPELICDWPTYTEHDSLTHPAYICAGVDPLLLGFENDKFRYGVFSSVTFDLTDLELKKFLDDSSDQQTQRIGDITDYAKHLLRSWDILPKWESNTLGRQNSNSDFAIRELSIHDTGVDTFGWVNDVTTRWVSRALQIAIIETGNHTALPKLLIWDEPELGLHPIAIRKVAEQVIPSLVARGYKIITSTHSMVIASKADQIYQSTRDSDNDPGLTYVSKFDVDKLEHLGFTSSDELLTRAGFIVVEGKHDFFMIDALFGDKLTENRIELLALDGLPKVLTLLEAPLLLKLRKPLMVIVDGGDRSGISAEKIVRINQALKMGSLESLAQLTSIASTIEPVDEGITIKLLLEKFIDIARREKSAELLNNLSLFMFSKNDILEYLEPRELWPSKSGDTNWQNYESKYREYEQHREKSQSEGLKVSKKKQSKKTFYQKKLGLPLDDEVINRAIQKMLDRSLDADFTNLEQYLFGDSAFYNH